MDTFHQKRQARRVSPQLVGHPNKGARQDSLVSHCSDCRKGIFTNHKYKWSGRGLIHINCNDPRGENETDVTT